ncbi:MAG: WYL domain-containing protein [Myxococcota bacterium]|nr:WYL domain-containing protein [Myxococcota bacterium]
MQQLNKGQKLVRIVELMTRRGGVRAVELMGRFDLDARSLRRYLRDLKDLDLPIQDEGSGDDRTISLDPTYRRSGVQLTLPEVLSLHFGRKLFAFLDDTQFSQGLDDALERLQPAIARAHAELSTDLDRKFMAVPEHAKSYADKGDLLDEVLTAVLYNNPAQAEYVKVSGAHRQYTLEPLTLATYRQGLYLFARDRQADQIKTFAVERFTRFSRLRLEKFTHPADYDPEEHIRGAFGIIQAPPQPVRAVFDSQVAPYLRERQWHPSQRNEELSDGRLRIHMTVGLSQELKTWLLGFGSQVVAEHPPELVDHLRSAHRQALERYA